MKQYKIIGIDLAKTKFHISALDENNKAIKGFQISRKDFIAKLGTLFAPNQTFAFEACSGCHNIGQVLIDAGHSVIALKPKDVKAYAKSRQKNDINDAIAICKAALDPDLKHVLLKTKTQQTISFMHKSRSNVIAQRIQITNSIMSSLFEFGYSVSCGKTKFAKECKEHVLKALEERFIGEDLCNELLKDCEDITRMIERERALDKRIVQNNKESNTAQLLETIPGIGPINASILSHKPMSSYQSAKDFAASLGLVPRQNTTGGNVRLGSITKQGDRYARTMLIQAGRAVVMRSCKDNPPKNALYLLIARLKSRGKKFNVICVAVANKLARIAYSCVLRQEAFNDL